MRRPKYNPPDSHIGPRTVRSIPGRDGDVVELGDMSPNPTNIQHVFGRPPRHTYLGFKPGTGGKPFGWIVVLVDESAHPASKPIKRRLSQGRSLRAVPA